MSIIPKLPSSINRGISIACLLGASAFISSDTVHNNTYLSHNNKESRSRVVNPHLGLVTSAVCLGHQIKDIDSNFRFIDNIRNTPVPILKIYTKDFRFVIGGKVNNGKFKMAVEQDLFYLQNVSTRDIRVPGIRILDFESLEVVEDKFGPVANIVISKDEGNATAFSAACIINKNFIPQSMEDSPTP